MWSYFYYGEYFLHLRQSSILMKLGFCSQVIELLTHESVLDRYSIRQSDKHVYRGAVADH